MTKGRKNSTTVIDFQSKMMGGVKPLIPMNVQSGTRLTVCQIISGLRECSLAELNQLFPLFCTEFANRSADKPLVGDTVHFSDGVEMLSGTVIRRNRKSVTVLMDGKQQMRVAYCDLQKTKPYLSKKAV